MIANPLLMGENLPELTLGSRKCERVQKSLIFKMENDLLGPGLLNLFCLRIYFLLEVWLLRWFKFTSDAHIVKMSGF